MILKHAISKKKKERHIFAFEIEAKVDNAEYNFYMSDTIQQYNYNIIVTNDDDFEEIYVGKSSNNIINLPTAGKYYIKCVGVYDGFQLQRSDINIVEFKKILNWGTNEWERLTGMFSGCKNLTTINFEGGNFDKITNLWTTFKDCTSLTTLDLSNFNNVTSLEDTFTLCESLENLDFGNTFEKVTNMRSTFWGCTSLTSLDLSNFDLSAVTTLSNTFNNCTNLTDVNLSNVDLSAVTNLTATFFDCTNLTTIDFGLNTFESVENMASTFSRCTSLETIDLSKMNLSAVTNMPSTFWGCTSLETIDFGLNTFESVENMSATFFDCTNLETLDLSKMNLSNVTDMQYAFSGCTSLENLDFGLNTFENVTMMRETFRIKDYKLPDISRFLLTNLTNFYNNIFSDTAENRIMYEYILSVWATTQPIKSPTLALHFGSVKATATAQIYKDELLQKGYNITDGGEHIDWGDDFVIEIESKVDNAEYDLWMNDNRHYNYNIIVTNDDDFEEIYVGKYNSNKINFPTAGKYYVKCSGIYEGFRLQRSDINIVEFKNILNWGANEWLDLNNMFNGCVNLTAIDFKGGNFNNVTTLQSAFYGCKSLTSIDFGQNTFENVTTLSYTFAGCRNLENVDFRNITFENVTKMSSAFTSCSSLTTLDLSNLNLSNLTDLAWAFRYCSSLTSIDLPNFNNATALQHAFEGCSSLTSINFGNNTFENVGNLTSTFKDCSSLTALNLSSLNLSNVTSLLTTFSNCSNLETINFGNNTLEKCFAMSGTFNGLKDGKLPDISKFILTDLTVFDNHNFSDSVENRTMCEYILSIWSTTLPIKSPALELDFRWIKATPQAQIYKSQLVNKGYNITDASDFWGDDFVIEIESKVDNAVYDLYRNGTTVQNVFDIDVIDKTTNSVISTQSSTSSASNNITLPTAGNYYIRCRGYYAGFRLNYDSNNMLVDVINVGTNEWLNMQNMFQNCINITSIDFEGANFNNVTNLTWAFSGCSSLTSLDLTDLDLTNVTDLSYAFQNCSSLENVDFGNNTLENVTTLRYTFLRCNSLTSLDFSDLDLSKVTTLVNTFQNCTNLISINFGNNSFENVTSLLTTFLSCSSLENLDFGNITFENVTTMIGTFNGLKDGKLPDISNFLLTNLTTFNNIFSDTAENRTMYEYILSIWSTTQPIKSPSITLKFGSVKATAQAQIYKDELLNKGYIITDGGNV